MTLKSLVHLYVKKLNKAGIASAQKEIRLLIREIIGINLENQIIDEDLLLSKNQKILIQEALNRRLNREPINRILNKTTFRDFELSLNRNTFAPRKETELLIDIIINLNLEPNKILELGTGSGAISIALMRIFPKCECISTDINQISLKTANQNARKNNVLKQINFICCNWLDIFVNFDFNVIIANPPYIKSEVIESLDPEVKCYDPIISLDGGKYGLDSYKKIILGFVQKRFINNSVIIFEIGHDQAEEVKNLMKEAKIMKIKVFRDYSNQARFILGVKKKTVFSDK
ncbi:MAG: protein-(glutamine-N5) methyltransferase, release factor-specific [Pelagibacterales bacterium]|nr:protein-(glutamine-N5) methyltransferase, release factor-specific [Pelagibacterales bacterium]OUU61590.1 MAG: protein-(glutamine-N5) methyltransferase, release factor-specific [Alphaproteobacteria bacterium TMED62]|tara:strand:+ start:3507 stop:4370 length:864 start_codon:yes stop_codon:yes gene_type:complete